MNRRQRHALLALALCCAFFACSDGSDAPADRAAEERLNFVLFIIDDLGWIDTGVYGSTFYETPNIDRLTMLGARFTQFYTASPVCSPTRASIMTGKHPARLQITNWIGGEQKGRLLQADYLRQLPLDEITLGEAFESAGYVTGYIGKWHLGAEGFLPDSQGFDTTIAVNHAGQPGSYFYPYENDSWPITNVPSLEDGVPGDYLTDRLTDEALTFLDEHADEPFFLVFSHYAVHTPLQSKESLSLKYEAKAAALPEIEGPTMRPEGTRAQTKQRQDHAVYAGMIQSTDESVGRVLDKLEQLGLDSRTAVVFVSDNGGLSTLVKGRTSMPTSNLPLRSGKGWLYEGGIRAPLIIRWPGAMVGSRTIEQPATSMDLYPTLLEMAGIPAKPAQHVDGISLAPALEGWGGSEHEALFWHFPHYHGSGNVPSGAVRVGDYKLIEWFEDGRVELYDLAADLGETEDLAVVMPEVTEELRTLLDEWRERVGAGMPSLNPDWTESVGEGSGR
jgi:arylsulfatase A-like enzyme